MRTFPLRIGTPDGLLFEGEVQRIVCRSITGDLAILAGPVSYTHLRAHETGRNLVCRLLLEKKKKQISK